MKKVFLFIAAAALTLAACEKKPVIPVDPDDPDKPTPEVPDVGFKEKTFKVDVVLTKDVTTNYTGVVAEMPGDDILDFLGLTANEFYAGFGTISGSGTGGDADLQRSQENNTIMFGVANANNTDDLKWNPATSGNCGQYFKADGSVTYWSDEASLFFIENHTEWGLDGAEAETLEGMWQWTIGIRPDHYDGSLSNYKATQVFFYTDEDDVELYAYVEWNLKIEAAEAVTLNVVKTQEVSFTSEFNNSFIHTDLVSEIDADALQAAIGVSMEEADVYGINGDGTPSVAPGKNFWFTAEEGNITGYGSGAGLCINDDAGTNSWAWCMYPDETLSGKTIKGAIAFVNPTTLNAYVVKVSVVLSTIDYLVINTLVSYEAGETVYTLSEKNIAAIADALGVETLDLAAIGGDIAIKGVNADGSIYEGEYTANNGYWYSSKGDVTTYNSADFNTYIEYRGEGNFGCGLWGETGETNTVKLALVKGDKTAILTFNLEVDEQKAYETEEVGTLNLTATQKIAAGYGGEVIIVDYDALCTTLGLTDEDFEEKFAVLTVEGTMDYTGEAPGFWFNVNNEICGWSDVDSAYYLNFKYGAALADASAGKLQINTGIRNDNSTNTDGEVTHTCPPAGTYTAVVRLANVETLKHVTLTVTLTVTAD